MTGLSYVPSDKVLFTEIPSTLESHAEQIFELILGL